MSDEIRLAFHGAAGTVTGSRHLLSANGSRVLVDAGLFQGLKALRLKNWDDPPFDPRGIDELVLTHTHIDHAGYLPRLVRKGFGGIVHTTRATKELARLLLVDAAHIQEEDAEYANRKRYSKHRPALPLFTAADAEEALQRLRARDYGEWFGLPGGMEGLFRNAGHILGSASLAVRIPRNGSSVTVCFSGDVGKYDMPLHPDPKPPPACDFLVVESTYGDRTHDPASFLAQVGGPLRETLEGGGTVLVPSFAVARAQLVTLILREAMKAGSIPEVPVHIDSPMAVDATRIYSRFLDIEDLDPELVAEGRERLFPKNVHFHRTTDESKDLNRLRGPRVIISASGMLTAGRVLHHLRRLLPKKRNLVLLVGYQAAGTRGRLLMEGATTLKMHGQRVPVRARHLAVHGLSAHADRDELLRWIRSAERPPRAIFVVHGEPDASAAFADLLRREIGVPAHVPGLHQEFELTGRMA